MFAATQTVAGSQGRCRDQGGGRRRKEEKEERGGWETVKFQKVPQRSCHSHPAAAKFCLVTIAKVSCVRRVGLSSNSEVAWALTVWASGAAVREPEAAERESVGPWGGKAESHEPGVPGSEAE